MIKFHSAVGPAKEFFVFARMRVEPINCFFANSIPTISALFYIAKAIVITID